MPVNGSSNSSRNYATYSFAFLSLMCIYIVAAYKCELIAQGNDARDQPSSLEHSKTGTGALYSLLDNLGVSTSRQLAPWSALPKQGGLLIVIEPLSRHPQPSETGHLKQWVDAGGSLLYICSGSPREPDESDEIAGELSLVRAAAKFEHAQIVVGSPYAAGARTLAVSSKLRIDTNGSKRYKVLVTDSEGVVAVEKKIGRGKVIVITDDLIAANDGIALDDNSVFLVNIVSSAIKPGRLVLFDEYHHGVGFEDSVIGEVTSLYGEIPPVLRRILFLLLFGSITYVISENIKKRPILEVQSHKGHAVPRYGDSYARLLRKSNSTALAVRVIYESLLRDLRIKHGTVDMAPSDLIGREEQAASKTLAQLRSTVLRCEAAIAGSKVTENELLGIAQNVAEIRRELSIGRD